MPTPLTDADKVIRNDTGISIVNALTALSGVVRGGNENIGDAYNSSNSYAAGDYCIYENILYKCIGATSGAWDSSKWTAVTISDEISRIDGKLIKRINTAIQLSQVSFTQSSSGMYYYETTLNIPSGSLIVSISCGNWGKLRSTDILEPYIAASNKIGLMSNIGNFLSDSVIELILIYI